jgi:serine/threonine-protein kinase
MSTQIRVVAGPDVGKVFFVPPGKSLLVGRGNQADVQINDPSVSRAHCRVRARGAKVLVEDLGSRGGVLLNGERVTEHPLGHQDVVQIGATQLRVELRPLAEQDTILTTKPPRSRSRVAAPAPVRPALPEKSDKPPLLPSERIGDLTGYRLGAYRVGPQVARGQSGPLFRAADIKTGRAVALKVLWPEITRDGREVRRFVRAMRTMMPVRHVHLVELYGAGKASGYCWVAMEFVDGASLADTLKKAPNHRLGWRDALRVGVHVSRALVYAHHKRIVHRNITPRNILIAADGSAKLGDLMLTKALEGSLAGHITSTGQLLGDLSYVAPERTSGQVGAGDERSDLYSLGATLYTALTGRPPLVGKSMLETILKIRQETPAPARTLQPAVPAEFERVVMKLLAKTPEDRFPKAAELLRTVQNYATGQGVAV